MEYKIEEHMSFTVCGMGIEITKSQSTNMKMCRSFWIDFNKALKANRLGQGGNWIKYAFTYKENDKIYYFCAIPQGYKVPNGFQIKSIPNQLYLVCKHVGNMDTLKNTVNEIYKNIIPSNKLEPDKTHFSHFEKYDSDFYWNSPESVINIYVPVTEKSVHKGIGDIEYGNDI